MGAGRGCACSAPSGANIRSGASRGALAAYGCMGSMCSGFRAFVLRGNVVDLAVAIVVGTSFTALVNATVADLVTPTVGIIAGDLDGTFGELTFTIRKSVFKYGHFLNVLLTFVLVSLVLYFLVVLPMNKLITWAMPAPKKTRECPECISDIPAKARRCKFCCAAVEPLPEPASKQKLSGSTAKALADGDEVITKTPSAADVAVDAKQPAATSRPAPAQLCEEV